MMNEKYVDEVPAFQRRMHCMHCDKIFIKQAPEQQACEDCEEQWLESLVAENDDEEWEASRVAFQIRRDYEEALGVA
jgi:hypothetical protein